MEMLSAAIEAWLSDGNGYGFGCDHGFGCGHSSGSGGDDGSGYGFGHGDSCGHGFGIDDVSGYGFGAGDVNPYGPISGYADGSGGGFCHSYGIKTFDGEPVYVIDNTPTIIRKIRFGTAFGATIGTDLTLTDCCVCKCDGKFAHGETYRAAREALARKLVGGMSEDRRIAEFWKCHNRTDRYNGRDLWNWHHRLTGSCEMGRNQFCKERDIDIDGTEWTVAEFVELCKDSYGGKIIMRLLEVV